MGVGDLLRPGGAVRIRAGAVGKHMGAMEYWILGQVVLEGVILVGIIALLLRVRKWRQGQANPQEVRAILEETHLLKDELLETLQARKSIITSLIKQLDHKVQEAQKLLKRFEHRLALAGGAFLPGENPGPAESGLPLRERVELLHEQGLNLDQIASQLQISRGEVMLILDLSRVGTR